MRYRLRPSVSFVPTGDEMVWEFFQSNTRRVKRVKFQDKSLIDVVKKLNGKAVSEMLDESGSPERVCKFLDYLYDACLVEESELATQINCQPFNRTINFLADYFPTHEAIIAFQRIRSSHVLIIGVGAIGSWVSHTLAQSGVEEFTLCDPDVVKPGNLNRSLFCYDDIGKSKVKSVAKILKGLNPEIAINCLEEMIDGNSALEKVFAWGKRGFDLVINASDFPNVDTTSEIISKVCMKYRVPHIIAGGYNLHLSLIGPTIIPYETSCYQCIKNGLMREHPEDFSNVRKLQRNKRNIGNLSPLAGISASFVAFEAIRVLVKSKKLSPLMVGRRGEYNFLTAKLNFSEYPRIDDCDWCGNQ